jgi:hypothetical protein
LHLAVGGDATRGGPFISIEGRALVRVLAVAQVLELLELQVEHVRIFLSAVRASSEER